jgi:hypothetical protein
MRVYGCKSPEASKPDVHVGLERPDELVPAHLVAVCRRRIVRRQL